MKIQPAVTGKEDSCFCFFSQWSRVGHALRPIFMLWLVKIWQVSSCWKFMQHLKSCLFWQLKLTGCTEWNSAAIRSLLLSTASLFIGFLVEKYVTCQSRKSDFGWHRFRFHLAWCVRGLQSLKRYWLYLITFRSCISNGKPEKLLYFMFVFCI